MIKLCKSSRRRIRDREVRGVATIELAVVLPALLALTLGTMDLCSVMFLKESAVLAAYEGARQGVGRGQRNSDVIDRVQEFLAERNIAYNGDCVSISSPGFGGAATLENVTVTVQLPTEGNLLVPSSLFGGVNVSASVTMRKEYQNPQ
ncbi:pilus assembly protein [Rubripirellula sp.]|jgi:Flp pilus assembly protein TadG|nr:pilus assembly protein [Planctomycetaceae bacterium]MDA9858411.1 pilus assembly protein [Rubripirellula sp.]MDF1844219.1 pilus assembly protein [Rubripirellula sp.]